MSLFYRDVFFLSDDAFYISKKCLNILSFRNIKYIFCTWSKLKNAQTHSFSQLEYAKPVFDKTDFLNLFLINVINYINKNNKNNQIVIFFLRYLPVLCSHCTDTGGLFSKRTTKRIRYHSYTSSSLSCIVYTYYLCTYVLT